MRPRARAFLRRTRCLWALVGFLAGIISEATAFNPPQSLLSITNSLWRYYDQGAPPSPAWRAANYDDSFWPVGLGLFGFETTTLPYPIQTRWRVDPTRLTFYARTHFQWNLPQPIGPLRLRATTYLDDGAVFYLNGQEIGRLRMPTFEIHDDTLGFAAMVEGRADTIWLAAEPLLPGDNVLAVEVHQASSTSGDILFGLSLEAIDCHFDLFLAPFPSQLTAYACGSPSLTIEPPPPPGVPLQWIKDGAVLSGQTNRTLKFNDVNPTNAGHYWVEFITPCGVTNQSAQSVVTVMFDDFPMQFVDASWINTTQLNLVFVPSVSEGSADPCNFTVLPLCGGPSLDVLSATRISRTNILITTGPRDVLANYHVAASNLHDDCGGLPLAQNPSRRIAGPLVPLPGLTVRLQGNQIEINGSDCGVLQSSIDLIHWTDLPAAELPWKTTLAFGVNFYRLRLP